MQKEKEEIHRILAEDDNLSKRKEKTMNKPHMKKKTKRSWSKTKRKLEVARKKHQEDYKLM